MHPNLSLWSAIPNESSFSNKTKSGTMNEKINKNMHICGMFLASEEYYRTGYLGNYRGVDLIEMSQKADWTSSTYALKLDDTRVYLLSSSQEKLVKVAIEGETLNFGDTSISANANLTQANTLHKAYATSLISNSYFGIIDLA